MNQSYRYLYVGFMCHQVIEKSLKACYSHRHNNTPPYIHNLSLLAEKAGLYAEMSEEQKNFIDFLEPLNIQARYPTRKDKLLALLTSEKCAEIIRKTESELQWVMTKLYDQVQAYAKRVAERYHPKLIVVYGSYARGKATSDSDIDIAVVCDSLGDDFLEKTVDLFRLRRDIDLRIEPVLLEADSMDNSFYNEILRTGKIVYAATA
jgi:predicted nucleotidyltransferase